MKTAPTLDVAILSAGASKRFNSCKALATYNGRALIDHAIELALSVLPKRIHVITGFWHKEIEQHLTATHPEITCVYNSEWQQGIGSSLKAAANSTGDSEGLLILLVDQPLVTKKEISALITKWAENLDTICGSAYANTVGPPALFPRHTLPQLIALPPASGAKKLLSQPSSTTLQVPTAAYDIDTQEDLTAVQATQASSNTRAAKD